MAKVPSLKFISKLASCHALLDFVEETHKIDLTLLDEGIYSAVTEDLLLCLLQFYSDKITNELLKAVVPCHLRELKIDKCVQQLTFFGLTEVVKKCPHLQKISLKECDQLMSPGQFVLWSRIGVSITALSLESCHNVTDQVVQSALRHIPTLQHLNVSSCESLTETVFLLNEDLQKDREFTPSHETTHRYECALVSIDVSGCPGITATAVRHLTSLTGPTLKNVNLSWTSINLIAVLSLAGYSLPAMIELVISFYNKTQGEKYPKSDELYKCLLEFKKTLDKVEKQQEEKENSNKVEIEEETDKCVQVSDGRKVDSLEIERSTLHTNSQNLENRDTSILLLDNTEHKSDENFVLKSDVCSTSEISGLSQNIENNKIDISVDNDMEVVQLDKVQINLDDSCVSKQSVCIGHLYNNRNIMSETETCNCISTTEVNNGAHCQYHDSSIYVPNNSKANNADIELSSKHDCGADLKNSLCEECTETVGHAHSGGIFDLDLQNGETTMNGLSDSSDLMDAQVVHHAEKFDIQYQNGETTMDGLSDSSDLMNAQVVHHAEECDLQFQNGETTMDGLCHLSNLMSEQVTEHSHHSEASVQATELQSNKDKIIQTYKPQLVSVDITNKFTSVYETVGFDCLKEFLQCCPDLQNFGMSWTGLTDEMVKELTHYLTNLREINLNDCESVTYGITHIGQTCKKLQKVDLNGIHFIKDIFLRPFLLNSDLQCLYLAESDITDGTLFRLAVRKMDQFEELDLSWCDEVTVQGLNALCRKPSPIKKLSFRHCPATSLTLALMAENFKQLQKLNICSVDSITDGSVVYLVENLPLLEEIDLGWNSGLSDLCVKSLLKSCIYLKKAVLAGIKYLTSAPFLPIISDLEKFRRCQALLRFKLQERKVLEEKEEDHYSSDEEYEELCVPHRSTSYAPSLQVLELEYCDCVDDNHLAEIVAVCRGSLLIVDYFREAIKPVLIQAQKGKMYLSPSQK